jgi:hypothetical protein
MYAGLVLVGAAISFTAFSAQALELKECLSLDDMKVALKVDGQRSVVIGDRLAPRNAPGEIGGVTVIHYADIVTSNADGSLGYQIEGDLPRTQASTKMCVGARLTNIQLFDYQRPGTPEGAFLGGRFDEMLRANETLGTRPMVQADTLHPNDDGTWRLGLPMTILGNSKSHAGFMYTRMPDGEPQEMMIMGDTEFTPYALQRLGDVH